MAIWIGRYYAGGPLDADGLVLYRGWVGRVGSVYAATMVEYPCDDDPNETCGRLAGETPWNGPLPPEHPDDVATDARIVAETDRC